MRIGPVDVSWRRPAPPSGGQSTEQTVEKIGAQVDLITHLPNMGGWWPVIKESFSGAWQRNVVQPVEDTAAHPTFWACVTLIAGDVAKCRPMLMQEDGDGIETEVENSSYSPVIRKPNHYQNRIQFYSYWMLSKLLRGNTYVLKERDARNVIVGEYILDPTRVRPLVSPSGDVFYALQQDYLSGINEASVVVPASEIVHDTMFALYHPLCGLSPIYACGHAAFQASMIMKNGTQLFQRGSNIGGVVVAPGSISEATATRLEKHWQENYAGEQNVGKVAVLGDGLKFEKMNVMSAIDAQLIDQLKWDDEKICATLHVPGYKVGVGPMPTYNNVEALGQQYYGDCLQIHFESIELCQTEGLELKKGFEFEFDISALDRMDSVQRIDVATKGVVGGVFKPNEARARFNLRPVKGGDRVYMQKQNWPLELLGTDQPPAPAPKAPPLELPGVPTPAPKKALDDVDLDAVRALVRKKLAA